MKVINHTEEIQRALHLDEGSVKHEGNFLFSGKLNGHKVQICTEPADDDQESVNIYSIEIGDKEKTMNATKQQEREALARIKEIVAGLGENSYVGTALRECFSDAEQNIENDWALSMYDRWQYAEQHYETEKAAANEARAEIARLEAENKRLAAQVEREQEWKPYEDDRNVSEAEYQDLAKVSDTKVLNDAEAAEIIHQEFGFDINKIEIVRAVNTYEINRHRQLRKVGELKREALYNATDWNYIRFNVCGWFYEMKNGELRQFID